MLRFVALCLVLAAAAVAGVLAVGQYVYTPDRGENPPAEQPVKPVAVAGPVAPPASSSSSQPAEPSRPEAPGDDQAVQVREAPVDAGLARPLVIRDGRVLPMERQDVPSERDGKLLILGTPVDQTEYQQLPAERRAELVVATLGVRMAPGEQIEEREKIVDPAGGAVQYRRPRPTDSFEPGTTAIIRQKVYFRKLYEDDYVKKDDILGVINPVVQLEKMAQAQSKVEAAAAEVRASSSMKEESTRRLAAIQKSRSAVAGSVTLDDLGAARVTVDRYAAEEVAKRAAVVQAQRDLSATWAELDMYLVRSTIPGQIRTIYKQSGEMVRYLDQPILQLINTDQLRVEAQVDVQDALPLRKRIREAAKMREEANRLMRLARGGEEPAPAKALRAQAGRLLAVEVEASRPEPPLAVLSGHLQEVTAVAVSRGPMPRIVSGSEEGIVRIWERVAGQDRWQERYRLGHGAGVRAIACVGPTAKENLFATGTAAGRVRLFNLDDLKGGERDVAGRHAGAVNAIAFNKDGTVCATAGDDRAICLWDPATGELLAKKTNAHRAAITSLTFTPDNRLLSAGRDKRLVVWRMDRPEGGKPSLLSADELTERSGDVAQLGVDPTGEYVLFDERRELRVISLNTRRIEGTLVNPGAAGSFSTTAQFSPDGRMILTNGNGPGRLQLWRAPTASNRAAEVRQLLWSSGTVTCGAFDPAGGFIVTGTSDHRLLVWAMPSKAEAEKPLPGELTYVEDFLDTSLKRVTVRAMLKNPGWVIPGASATVAVPPNADR
ncbi:MAG: hypothetical protein U0736_21700 [Gemmataceae bacterium]